MSVVYTATQTFKNLNRAGKLLNLTASLGTGTLTIRRTLAGTDVDVPVTASGIYELAISDDEFTVVVTGDAKFSLE